MATKKKLKSTYSYLSNTRIDKTLLIGPRAVAEALRTGQPIDKVWYSGGAGARFREMLQALEAAVVPCQQLQPVAMRRIAGPQNQGLVARIAAMPFADLSEVLIRVFERGESPLVLVVDRCTDVRNVGAMVRSAEALGAHALVLEQQESAALGEDCMRASAGALLHLPLCRFAHLSEAFALLKNHGLEIVAATGSAKSSCTVADLSGPIALVVGAERSGIRPALLQIADKQLHIPMAGKVEALNVSAAAAILLYEASKQRQHTLQSKSR